MCVVALDSLKGKLCPPFGLGVRFEVATIQTSTTMFGCTYLEHNLTISAAPVFNLWLEPPVKTSNHGHCKDMRSMYNELLLLLLLLLLQAIS